MCHVCEGSRRLSEASIEVDESVPVFWGKSKVYQGVGVKTWGYTYACFRHGGGSGGLAGCSLGGIRAADRGVRAAEFTKQLLTKYECTRPSAVVRRALASGLQLPKPRRASRPRRTTRPLQRARPRHGTRPPQRGTRHVLDRRQGPRGVRCRGEVQGEGRQGGWEAEEVGGSWGAVQLGAQGG